MCDFFCPTDQLYNFDHLAVSFHHHKVECLSPKILVLWEISCSQSMDFIRWLRHFVSDKYEPSLQLLAVPPYPLTPETGSYGHRRIVSELGVFTRRVTQMPSFPEDLVLSCSAEGFLVAVCVLLMDWPFSRSKDSSTFSS